MRKYTKSYLFTLVCVFLFHLSNGQLVNNKFNLHFSYGLAAPLGEANVQEGSFVSPALLANMQQGQAFSITGTYQLKPYLSSGIVIGYDNFSDWTHTEGFTKYEGATMQMLSLAPMIRIHTKAAKRGFFNRFRFFAECNPGLGQVKVTLENPIFEVQPVDDPGDVLIETPVASQKIFPGIQAALGSECILGDGWGAAIRLGYHQLWTEDILYTENTLSFLAIQGGLFLRMVHEKRFYY